MSLSVGIPYICTYSTCCESLPVTKPSGELCHVCVSVESCGAHAPLSSYGFVVEKGAVKIAAQLHFFRGDQEKLGKTKHL